MARASTNPRAHVHTHVHARLARAYENAVSNGLYPTARRACTSCTLPASVLLCVSVSVHIYPPHPPPPMPSSHSSLRLATPSTPSCQVHVCRYRDPHANHEDRVFQEFHDDGIWVDAPSDHLLLSPLCFHFFFVVTGSLPVVTGRRWLNTSNVQSATNSRGHIPMRIRSRWQRCVSYEGVFFKYVQQEKDCREIVVDVSSRLSVFLPSYLLKFAARCQGQRFEKQILINPSLEISSPRHPINPERATSNVGDRNVCQTFIPFARTLRLFRTMNYPEQRRELSLRPQRGPNARLSH